MSGATRDSWSYYRRGIVVILTSTFILTAVLVGVIAFFSNTVSGIRGRFPWYVLGSGVIFVGVILLLEHHESSGRTIIITALSSTIVGLFGIVFSFEGVMFAIQYPEQVFVSQLIIYLFAAGLFSTGVFYWGVNHWREFSKPDSEL